MPQGMCYAWQSEVLWLNVISDGVILVSYLSIPFALIVFIRWRHDLEFKWIFELFAAFIILSAITHFVGIWVVWKPDYGVQGVFKAVTAIVSLTTAAALWPLLPKALALPGPTQLKRANQELAGVNDQLEKRVAERTAQLEARHRDLVALNRDLRERDAEITRLMMTDPLTGVANRRRLEQVLDAEIERNRRYGSPLCVGYVDVDDFKAINDRYGHEAGDLTLKEVVSVLSSDLRANDTIARYGGDEFILVLPETSEDEVAHLMERARASLSETRIPGTDEIVRISIGAAVFRPGDSRDDILRRADRALYEAKGGGKNKVVLSA